MFRRRAPAGICSGIGGAAAGQLSPDLSAGRPVVQSMLRELVDWPLLIGNLRSPKLFPSYCVDFLKIQTKEALFVPFEFNFSQRLAWDLIAPHVQAGGRWIVLKARQVGISTLIEAIIDWRTSLNSDVSSLIMAHDADTSSRLYKMFRTYTEYKPSWLRPRMASSGNEKGLNFKSIRSSVRVITAGSRVATSGDTFHCAHLSEYAKWDHPVEVMTSLTPTLPKNALVFIESTPYGLGNDFYLRWIAAKEGRSDYIPIFLPWYNDPGYTLDKVRVGNNEAYDADPTKAERYYVDRYNLNQGQMNWMRWMVDTDFNGSFDGFIQEYPFDDVSCFLSSGKPYFDMGALRNLDLELRKARHAVLRGEFDSAGQYFPGGDEDVTIWDVPNPAEQVAYRYVISADCCEGGGRNVVDDGQKRTGDTDWNYCIVRDKVLDVQVAEIRNKKDPDLFADQLFWIWRLYGNGLSPAYWPLMIVERNNPGQAVLLRLRQLLTQYKVPYSRLFHQGDMNKDNEPTLKDLGFRTQKGGDGDRLAILADVQRRIRLGKSGVLSQVIIDQCLTFIKDKNQKPIAQEGRYDDGVIALALNYEGERRDNPAWELPKPVRRSAFDERMMRQKQGLDKNRSGYRRNRYA